MASTVSAPQMEESFFDGLDTGWTGLPSSLTEGKASKVEPLLLPIQEAVDETISSFDWRDPSRVVPTLAGALAGTRRVMAALEDSPDALHLLRIKERQFMGAIECSLAIEISAVAQPEGWTSEPPRHGLRFHRAGETAIIRFGVRPNPPAARDNVLRAVAELQGMRYNESFHPIEHRDLETRYDVRESSVLVRGIGVRISPGLHAGYVVGAGDAVPEGMAQLGVNVTFLEQEDLAEGNLTAYDAIVIGLTCLCRPR